VCDHDVEDYDHVEDHHLGGFGYVDHAAGGVFFVAHRVWRSIFDYGVREA
jgi:hypothetical protein